MAQSNTTLFPVPMDIGKVPREGACAVPAVYDFSGGVQAYDTDMTAIKQLGRISMVQSVFIDNSNNTQPIVLSVSGTKQSISVPASFQGVFPVIVGGQASFHVTSTGNGIANIYFCNVQQAAFMWQAIAIPLNLSGTLATADAILDATVSNNRVNTTAYEAPATLVDASGAIAAGGTAQNAAAANIARRGFLLQNLDAAEELYVRLTGASVIGGAGSFVLGPYASLQGVGTGAISVIATTTAHKFSLVEW